MANNPSQRNKAKSLVADPEKYEIMDVTLAQDLPNLLFKCAERNGRWSRVELERMLWTGGLHSGLQGTRLRREDRGPARMTKQ